MPQPLGFNAATRLSRVVLPTMVKPTGGGATAIQLPKTALLARLYLLITGTVTGTVTTPNPLGFASVVRRVRLTINSGVDIFNVSGPGYHYLLRNFHNIYFDPFPSSNARSVITATTFDVSILVDVMLNQRDAVGLIMLQNEQTVVTLTIEWESDTVIVSAGGATTAATCVPVMETFAVPQDPANWPNVNVVHSLIEDTQAVSAAGDFTYVWPRGNTYLAIYHALGIAATGATNAFNRLRLRVNQSNFLEDYTTIPQALDVIYNMNHPAVRITGTAVFDFMGDAGLGAFGLSRDMINSGALTDIATVITATGAGTLYSIRRQLISLGG